MAKRKDVEAQIRLLSNKGATLGEVAKKLHEEGYTTAARGSKITSSYVNYVLRKKNKSNGKSFTGSSKKENDSIIIPFRILKSVIVDPELSDTQKINILKSFYRL